MEAGGRRGRDSKILDSRGKFGKKNKTDSNEGKKWL
jgi:hypothetical protein